jgi:hypothetical protein
MAPNPNLRLTTVAYQGGTATGVRGLMDYLFDTDVNDLEWAANDNPVSPVTNRRRRKYGTRQRSSSRAGEQMQVVLKTGEVYTLRVTGTHTAFLDAFLAQGGGVYVSNVFSERGTIYGPRPQKKVAA